jgi:site-specific recombinase XerC
MSELITKLNLLLQEHADTRVNGRVASHRTATAAGEALRNSFKTLEQLGFRLEDPKNLAEKHVTALCRHWYSNQLAPKTIQGYLSHLRIFARWVGKGDMVKGIQHYLPSVPAEQLRARTVARTSKGWTENGVDIVAKIQEADAEDWRFGLQLRMQVSFGLRRMEVLQNKPWKCDRGDKFAVYATKGGRPRDIYVQTAEQRAVLDMVKAALQKDETLGWKTTPAGRPATLAYSTRKYSRLMRKIGISRDNAMVTGHGLRAQYAENAALIANLVPPTLGGSGGQLPKDEIRLAKERLSELLGHSRESVAGAYVGSFGRQATPDPADRQRTAIEACISRLLPAALEPVPQERVSDCITLVGELARQEIEITIKQIHHLWRHHSRRHATSWAKPLGSNMEAIEAAAIALARASGGVR